MEYEWKDEGAGGALISPGSVLLSCFPSAGLATLVAGHYMVRTLKMPRVGRFDSADQPPIAVVQGGEVNPTIRVYGHPGLGLVLSEFPPTAAQATAVARTLLDGAQRRKVRMIICLEGVVPHPEDGEEEGTEPPAPSDESIWAAYSTPDAGLRAAFQGAKAHPLEDGVIGGVSGALLVRAIGEAIPVVTLLVSARVAEGIPDNRAGAALIETLDRVLPEFKIDTKPLREQAEQIERMLRAALQRRPGAAAPAEGTPDADASKSPGMYG